MQPQNGRDESFYECYSCQQFLYFLFKLIVWIRDQNNRAMIHLEFFYMRNLLFLEKEIYDLQEREREMCLCIFITIVIATNLNKQCFESASFYY